MSASWKLGPHAGHLSSHHPFLLLFSKQLNIVPLALMSQSDSSVIGQCDVPADFASRPHPRALGELGMWVQAEEQAWYRHAGELWGIPHGPAGEGGEEGASAAWRHIACPRNESTMGTSLPWLIRPIWRTCGRESTLAG